MNKEKDTSPFQHVVPGPERGGSSLLGAAQRGRSRQIWPTLEAALGDLDRAERYFAWGLRPSAFASLYAGKDKLREAIAALRRRRPFGANVEMTDQMPFGKHKGEKL